MTAPGRQAANADELVDLLSDAARTPVVVLTAEEEGGLAWEGAVAFAPPTDENVGVVDLGGGSCEVAIGRRATGPDMDLLSRCGRASRDPRTLAVGTSDRTSSRIGAGRDPRSARRPRSDAPDRALAVGGTARAVSKVIGPRFGARKLDELAERIVRDGAAATTAGLDVTPGRSETLLGGTLILAEVARRLDSKLEVGRGGLREGAALALARAVSAAA